MRIGFLFNHDGIHQIAHTVPIVAMLAADGIDVEVMTSTPEQEEIVRGLLPANTKARFTSLELGPLARAIDGIAGLFAPFRRVAILRQNLDRFAALDALVVPETTSALLKDRFGLAKLKLIYLPHGAGDRSIGFRDVTRSFDLVLLSGRKVRDRMLASGIIGPENHAIVGYPKFDAVGPRHVPRFFENDRPTILYNPHFDPLLSSWYKMGEQVLDWFARQDRYNLIFAPHVMLFKRRLHASVEHRQMRIRRALPTRFMNLPHIRIDTGSTCSIDMSYTRAADIYLGDVSSQIYEWILRPRPAIFLNSHRAQWNGNPNYSHWKLGEVLDDVAELQAALERAEASPHRFAEQQAIARDDTFSLSDVPSGRRAADAILSFMKSHP